MACWEPSAHGSAARHRLRLVWHSLIEGLRHVISAFTVLCLCSTSSVARTRPCSRVVDAPLSARQDEGYWLAPQVVEEESAARRATDAALQQDTWALLHPGRRVVLELDAAHRGTGAMGLISRWSE